MDRHLVNRAIEMLNEKGQLRPFELQMGLNIGYTLSNKIMMELDRRGLFKENTNVLNKVRFKK